ncbi:MAG: S-layer homology domain-containing protein [Firmicutes bacterium]|nr:S-layer homology domain-containing protein [Bacillota bacterium]
MGRDRHRLAGHGPASLKTFVVLLLALLLLGGQAEAYVHYPPAPQGPVGISRPLIVKRLVFGSDERFAGADLWLDGVKVPAAWDPSSGYLYYIPPEPLSPGPHRVQLVVRAESTDPDWYFTPLQQEFTFTVDPAAPAELPLPDAESRHALAYLNSQRAAAGLPLLALDPALNAAAAAHAGYVAANPTADAHTERPGTARFTGVGPGDRAAYFGYYEAAGEVVAHYGQAEAAIDAWLATLYHRVPLINPANRLMGYGHAGDARLANVVECGPAWPFGPASDGGTGAAPGSLLAVRWPYPGQTGVPTSWPGLESPDPLRLYPGVSGPVGYTVSLTFAPSGATAGGVATGEGTVDAVNLESARLTDAAGTEVRCMVYSPAIDEYLTDTVALIPYEPLGPNTTYTAHFTGTVTVAAGEAGGPGTEAGAETGGTARPFDETWSFTTGAGAIETGPVVRWSWTWSGDRVRLEFEGLRLREGVAAFLGGLPVRELSLLSRTELSFRVPAGFGGGPAALTLAAPDGTELTLDLDSPLPAAPASAGKAWTDTGPPFPFTRRAVRHAGGTVMVPTVGLAEIGAVPEPVPEASRTHWVLDGRIGTLTLGSPAAYVDGRLLRLPLPAQELRGETYVPAEFVRALIGAAGVLYDLAGHWAAGEVTRLVDLGVVSGMGDGTFRPDARLTRAAFVKMAVLAAGFEPRPGDTGGFADTAGHWVAAQGYIGAAAAAGIVRPAEYPGGRFEPDREITRQEIAVMVVRAMGLEGRAEAAAAPDGHVTIGGLVFCDAGTWTRPGYVQVAVEEGIVRGYAEPDGTHTFRPAGLATRAEAAVMVTRMLDWRAGAGG